MNVFSINCTVSSKMTNVPKLMQRWISGEAGDPMIEYHPQIQGFYSFLEKFQPREGDLIYSSARIPLLFSVKPDFTRALSRWEGTSQIVLFVTLSAQDRNYKKEDDLLFVQISRTPLKSCTSVPANMSSVSSK